MNIKIHNQNFDMSNELFAFVDGKVRLALGLFEERIRRVDVYLADTNGPKGGDDMSCKIQVKTDGHSPIVVHAISGTMFESVGVCAQKIKRGLVRRFQRAIKLRKLRSREHVVNG